MPHKPTAGRPKDSPRTSPLSWTSFHTCFDLDGPTRFPPCPTELPLSLAELPLSLADIPLSMADLPLSLALVELLGMLVLGQYDPQQVVLVTIVGTVRKVPKRRYRGTEGIKGDDGPETLSLSSSSLSSVESSSIEPVRGPSGTIGRDRAASFDC